MRRGISELTLPMIPLIERDLIDETRPIWYEPAIPVRLTAKELIIERYALIDTGSAACLVNRKLLIEPSPSTLLQKSLEVQASTGGRLKADSYLFKLDICNQQFQVVNSMGFVRFLAVDMPDRYHLILGHEGFLENAKVTFDYPQRRLEIIFRNVTDRQVIEDSLAEIELLVQTGNYATAVAALSIRLERILRDIIIQRISLLEKSKSAMFKGQTLEGLSFVLRKREIISSHNFALLNEFALLRNRAVHNLKPLQKSDALRAIHIARQVMLRLKTEQITFSKSQVEVSVDNAFKRANFHFNKQEYESALEYYNKCLAIEPHNTKYLTKRGITYRRLKRYHEALADFNQCLKIKPKLIAARRDRGIIYGLLERYEEALADFNKAIGRKPDPVLLTNMGTAYCELGRYDEALTVLNQSLEIDPYDPITLNSRGIVYDSLEQFDKALSDYDNALALDPFYPEVHNDRGVVYSKTAFYTKAMADFEKALEIKPDYAAVFYNMACLYSIMNKPTKSLAKLRKAISLDNKFRQLAITESDFDNIRDKPRFQNLIKANK